MTTVTQKTLADFQKEVREGAEFFMKPYNKRIIVKPIVREETLKSGLIIPESVNNNVPKAIIVSKAEDVNLPVKVGDLVMCAQPAGYAIVLKGDTYVILHEMDILALFQDSEHYSIEPKATA